MLLFGNEERRQKPWQGFPLLCPDEFFQPNKASLMVSEWPLPRAHLKDGERSCCVAASDFTGLCW